ncbi:MAG: PilN domain-containing protein [Planctomycetia bacterium]|nr:PilN domain-containing protein [Planctomycetia bacterium]
MKDRLNLLPLAFQRNTLRRTQIRQWSVAAGICGILVASIGLFQHYELHRLEQGLQMRRLRAEPLEALRTQNEQQRNRLALLLDDQKVLAELESEQLAFHLLSTVSRSAASCTDGVQVQQFSFSRSKSIVKSPQTGATAPSDQQQTTEVETLVMTVKGIGADNLTVSRFVVALRDSLLFEKVDLRSSTGGQGPVRGVRSFVVECTL